MDGGSGGLSRQQRRRAARQAGYSIQDFHHDAAGVLSIGLLTPIELAVLIDRHAGLAGALIDWLAKIEETRPLCACCDFVFTRSVAPAVWLIVQAVGNPAARGVVLMGCCDRCVELYPTAEALIAAVAEALKRGAWPDLRVLDRVHMHVGGGRA
jgi:hypothetical protein